MNKYDHLNRPEDELDFHDEGVLDGATVKRMTEAFVRDAGRRGLRRVRLIVGKGRGSKGRPVVGPQVRRTLDGLQREGLVAHYADAKVTEGGHGAIDVELGGS